MSYKIAIYTAFSFHLECIGFLCELINNNHYLNLATGKENYLIDIYLNTDKYKYITEFQNIYKEINKLYRFPLIKIKAKEYDLIIKLTGNDNHLNIRHPNILSIVHRFDCLPINKNERLISLSPAVNLENIIPDIPYNYESEPIVKKINYIFPVFNPSIKNQSMECINKQILYIGHFIDIFFDNDFKNLVQNLPDYQFLICRTNKHNYINMDLFMNYPNLKIINNCNTNDLFKYIVNSKFILCRKNPYQNINSYSGAIGLAQSFRKPILINKCYATIYNIDCLPFIDNYSELIDDIKNMTNEDYNLLVQKIDTKISLIQNHNKLKFSMII